MYIYIYIYYILYIYMYIYILHINIYSIFDGLQRSYVLKLVFLYKEMRSILEQ